MNRYLARLMGQMYMQANPGDAGGTGDAAAVAAAAAKATADAAAAAAATGQKPWFDGFKDPETKTWIEGYKGAYPDAESVAKKALHLERFIGAEKAGRGVIIPKSDDKPEVWADFNKKVFGVPEKPEGYVLPKETPAEVAEALKGDPMLGKFQTLAHKIGMPPSMFQATMAFFMAESKTHGDTQMADFEKNAEADMEKLRTEWPGAEFDKNASLGQRAAAAFIPHKDKEDLEKTLTRIEGAIGSAATMKLFASIGKGLGEHGFVDGDSGASGFGNEMTAEAARARIAALKQDPEFGKKLRSGDANARKEWDDLHKTAFPEPKKEA